MKPEEIIYSENIIQFNRDEYFTNGWGQCAFSAEGNVSVTTEVVVPFYVVDRVSEKEAYVTLQWGGINESNNINTTNFNYPTNGNQYASHFSVTGKWYRRTVNGSGGANGNGNLVLNNICSFDIVDRGLSTTQMDSVYTSLLLPYPVFERDDKNAIEKWIRYGKIDNQIAKKLPSWVIQFEIDYDNNIARFISNSTDVDVTVSFAYPEGTGLVFEDRNLENAEWQYITLAAQQSNYLYYRATGVDKDGVDCFMSFRFNKNEQKVTECSLTYNSLSILNFGLDSVVTSTMVDDYGFIIVSKPCR